MSKAVHSGMMLLYSFSTRKPQTTVHNNMKTSWCHTSTVQKQMHSVWKNIRHGLQYFLCPVDFVDSVNHTSIACNDRLTDIIQITQW